MHHVEIRIEGQLDRCWLDWLGDFSLEYTPENQSVLSGPILDQAALFGLIGQLRDLGVTLLSVNYQGQPNSQL